MLEAVQIPIVSTDVSSFESCGVEESLEEVFARASAIKSIVMSAPDMNADKEEVERLIDNAEALIEMNPVEFMEPTMVDFMKNLWEGLDKSYVSCMHMFKKWQRDYATVLDATVETNLRNSVAKMKQDILAFKRDLMAKQRDFPANPPNPSSGSGGDQLTKHFRQEAKAKMLALHNQVKISCEGIQSDAQLDGQIGRAHV